MITNYKTNFRVYPEHLNNHSPLIFGGAFFSELDKAAQNLTSEFLQSASELKNAVTHKAEVVFHMPCYLGDMIYIEADVVETGKKSIVIEVKAYRQYFENKEVKYESVAEAKFVFISISDEDKIADKPKYLPYVEHGIKV